MLNLEMALEWASEVSALKPVGLDGDINFYDYAILGITDGGKLVYSKSSMIKLLSKNKQMSWEDATEFLEFNCFSTYIGEMGPIFINELT
jgi:hypothetical protein